MKLDTEIGVLAACLMDFTKEFEEPIVNAFTKIYNVKPNEFSYLSNDEYERCKQILYDAVDIIDYVSAKDKGFEPKGMTLYSEVHDEKCDSGSK